MLAQAFGRLVKRQMGGYICRLERSYCFSERRLRLMDDTLLGTGLGVQYGFEVM